MPGAGHGAIASARVHKATRATVFLFAHESNFVAGPVASEAFGFDIPGAGLGTAAHGGTLVLCPPHGFDCKFPVPEDGRVSSCRSSSLRFHACRRLHWCLARQFPEQFCAGAGGAHIVQATVALGSLAPGAGPVSRLAVFPEQPYRRLT